ncbi:MAG TPA: hypothetical protein VFC67_14085 [Prolixibacteraceae bacterium]|nr:hypothetical protein [Prolixibacteraceae bacterium]
MNIKISIVAFNCFIFSLFVLESCNNDLQGNIRIINHQPKIEPDYSDVTIPPNIAPMNFIIKEPGNEYQVILKSALSNTQISLRSKDGVIQFPEKSWKKLVGASKGDKITIQILSSINKDSLNKYEPISLTVANDPIDPYMAYRLISPGYYSWSDIKIEQRSLESFDKESVIENQIIDKNCVNCHSFNQNNPDKFLVHIRGSKGGTYFVDNGKITKTNLKTDKMTGGATYPYWHPGGRFVAFSSNQVRQSFYANYSKSIEVYDQSSSLILYDIQKNEIIGVPKNDTIESLQTFPAWSPDGKTLYYCEAYLKDSVSHWEINDIKKIHYNLVKKSFKETDVTFGETEIVVNANEIQKSVSFPRISPDGKFLIFTMADYGTFPIWHKEADLYMLDLENGRVKKMELNSNETDSYHSWSSNSKWLVFSSKRMDGRSTRPFIAYINSWDQIGKPFVLPQKDPAYYDNLVLSYNIPEFIKGKIKMKPRDFEAATKYTTIQAKSGKYENAVPGKAKLPWNNQPEIPNSIHE